MMPPASTFSGNRMHANGGTACEIDQTHMRYTKELDASNAVRLYELPVYFGDRHKSTAVRERMILTLSLNALSIGS